MPLVTFESPLLHQNVTVYAIAGDTHRYSRSPTPIKCRSPMIAATANAVPVWSRS
jgi:hypothetical protein